MTQSNEVTQNVPLPSPEVIERQTKEAMEQVGDGEVLVRLHRPNLQTIYALSLVPDDKGFVLSDFFRNVSGNVFESIVRYDMKRPGTHATTPPIPHCSHQKETGLPEAIERYGQVRKNWILKSVNGISLVKDVAAKGDTEIERDVKGRIDYLKQALGLVFLVFDSRGPSVVIGQDKEENVPRSRLRALHLADKLVVDQEVEVKRGMGEEGSWWPATICGEGQNDMFDIRYSKPPPGPHPIIYMIPELRPMQPPPPSPPESTTPASKVDLHHAPKGFCQQTMDSISRSIAMAPIILRSYNNSSPALWPVRILSDSELQSQGIAVSVAKGPFHFFDYMSAGP